MKIEYNKKIVNENEIKDYFKIIIIEDDKGLNTLIQKQLRRAGYEIDFAYTGKEALKKIAGTQNELLLLDYKLPDMTAMEMLELFKKNNKSPNFIIITGKGDEKVAVELMQAGARDYIVKDIEFQDKLVFRINKVCKELLNEIRLRLRKAALEATGDSIYLLDRNGRYLFLNQEHLKRLQEDEKIDSDDMKEIVGKKYSEIHSSQETKNIMENIKQVLKTGEALQEEYEFSNLERWSSRIYNPLIRPGTKKIEGVVIASRDITENKKAQEKLINSEKQFRMFAENVPGVVSIYKNFPDDHREIVYMGPGLGDILGEKLTKKVEDNPDIYFDLIPANDREALEKAAIKALKTDKRLDFEYRLKISEDNIKWVRSLFNLVQQDNGVILWEGLIFDITNRKKIEEELKESRSLYKTIIQSSGTAILIIEENNIISFANNKFKEISDYAKEEVEGKMKWTEFIVDEDLKMMQKYHKKRFENREAVPKSYEFRLVDKDKNIKYILLFVDLIQGTKKTVASLIDITKRKKMEKDLEYRTNYFRSLFKDSPEAILSIDRKNNIINVNPAFEELFGYKLEEVKGKDADDIIVSSEYKEDAVKVTEKVLDGEYTSFESVRTRKDGSEIDVSIIGTPIFVAGKQVGGFAIYRDISARKRAERIQNVLYNINKALSATENLTQLIEKIRNYLSVIVDTTNFYVALYNKEEDTISLPFMKDKKDDYETFPAGKTLTAYVINTEESLFGTREKVEELKKKGLVETIGSDSKIWLGVPLRVKDEVIGVLTVQSYESEDKFTHQDLNLLEMVAGEIARVLRYKQEAKKLAESEKRFRTFITSSATINFLKDENFRYLIVNKTFEDFLGKSEDEIIGKTDFDILPPKIARQFRESDKRALKAKDTIVLHEVMDDRIFEVRKFRAEIEGKIGVGGIMTDITERIASREKLEKSFEGTIRVISNTVEIRDAYTAGHQERVTQLALRIANKMGLSEEKKKGLEVAARVHDIGKITVPAEILSKPTKLTELEFSYIKEHPRVGYGILKNVDFPWPIADIVHQHHERMDGSGYPQGLDDGNIILEARILGVADVVEAISSHRPYRASLGKDFAINEIKEQKGQLYDSKVVVNCLEILNEGFEFKEASTMGD